MLVDIFSDQIFKIPHVWQDSVVAFCLYNEFADKIYKLHIGKYAWNAYILRSSRGWKFTILTTAPSSQLVEKLSLLFRLVHICYLLVRPRLLTLTKYKLYLDHNNSLSIIIVFLTLFRVDSFNDSFISKMNNSSAIC